MRVLMFKQRFVGKVLAGTKCNTMRCSARCKAGDTLSLRRWTGKPYRSKQEILRTEICTGVEAIHMEIVQGRGFSVWRDGVGQPLDQIDELARLDGFAGEDDMASWFLDEHGLPWDGFLIKWQPAGAVRLPLATESTPSPVGFEPAVSGTVRGDVLRFFCRGWIRYSLTQRAHATEARWARVSARSLDAVRRNRDHWEHVQNTERHAPSGAR